MIEYERELNPQQLKVVKDEGGFLLVLAGAGSGKTRTLTYRVAYLLERRVAPEKILLATFTNKAARSMLNRVENLADQYTGKIMGGTFHHIANVILRNYASRLGYRANYSILDSEDSRQMISTCVSELKIDAKSNRFPKSSVLSEVISLIFNTQSSLEEVLYARYPYYSHLVDEITQIALFYSRKKKELCVMDFDDLLLNFQILLTEHPDILKTIAGRFHHILEIGRAHV